MEPNSAKRLFSLVPIFKYLKRLLSKTDKKTFESIKIYLIGFVVISTVFNIFAINYMSNQAVIISNNKLAVDDTKEFINCVRNETSIYEDLVANKEVSSNVLAKKIRKCIYIFNMRIKENKYE